MTDLGLMNRQQSRLGCCYLVFLPQRQSFGYMKKVRTSAYATTLDRTL